MKSLNSFVKLTFVTSCMVLTTFVLACIYGDLIFNSTSYMEFSQIKFEKRLDDNYERFVASKSPMPITPSLRQMLEKKISQPVKIVDNYSAPAIKAEDKEVATEKEIVSEVITASFDPMPSSSIKKLNGAKVVSGEITVKTENNQIVEILSLNLEMSDSTTYDIASTVSVNPLSGQFSNPSSINSQYNDGGFVNFNNNNYTFNVRFFTGLLQDSLIVFKNKDIEQEVLAKQTNPEDPNEAYNQIVAKQEEEAVAALAEEQGQPTKLSFANEDEAMQHRVAMANPKNLRAQNVEESEDDDDVQPANEEIDSSDNSDDNNEETNMMPVDPEHAKGFSFESNNARI